MAGGTIQRGGRRGRRRRRSLADINVTPLVDVMLVLLIVFMVTAPLLTTGVAVDLPEARTSPLPGQDEPVTVTIRADGSLWLQDSAIGLDELGPRLAAVRERNPELRVFVRGDRAVDYGRVMAVVGTLNQAGIGKVALLTEVPRTAALGPRQEAR